MLFTAITVAYQVKYGKPVSHVVKVSNKPLETGAVTYDVALLDTFSRIASSLDIRNQPCTYSGEVSITDKADTTLNMKKVSFLFSQNGQDCYYKYGNTELLNAGGIYLYIEHDQHKIMVSSQKTVTAAGVGTLSMFKKGMVSEHYALSSVKTDRIRTIRLLNEHHISCKEYALSYDTLSHKVTGIYARLSNPTNPGNPAMDKIIELHFRSWTNKSSITRYLKADQVVRTEGNELKLTDNYHNYELVRTQ